MTDGEDLIECAICGGEKPADLIDETTVEPIEPMTADICRSCQIVQDHEPPEGVCMQCGDDVDPGFHIEVEYPLGAAGFLALKTGSLCGDCAGWVACDINYQGIGADEDAHDELLAALEEETEQLREMEVET
jgi:hypothetical protein